MRAIWVGITITLLMKTPIFRGRTAQCMKIWNAAVIAQLPAPAPISTAIVINATGSCATFIATCDSATTGVNLRPSPGGCHEMTLKDPDWRLSSQAERLKTGGEKNFI
jgi:hypothetical protein